jgi:predicted PurR-regulated permease PerM|tara:strand:+ start:137 stop:442 length:306 start_codon:yes stop_codon:yes gene_type:complete
MEITSFIVGVCAVTILVVVNGTFVNYMAIKTLKSQFDNLDKYANRIEQSLNQRINTEIQDLSQNANNDDKEIIRYIDSRVEKLEDKIYTDFDVKKKQTKNY